MQIKIKSIQIELELKDQDETNPIQHATHMNFINNMWAANGPLYPRFIRLMNDILEETRK